MNDQPGMSTVQCLKTGGVTESDLARVHQGSNYVGEICIVGLFESESKTMSRVRWGACSELSLEGGYFNIYFRISPRPVSEIGARGDGLNGNNSGSAADPAALIRVSSSV
jgi:hypothetical protein